MSFIESIKTVLSKYAVFNGRARRSEYWWYALAVTIVTTILYAVLVAPSYGEYMSAILEASAAGAAPPAMPGALTAGYLIMSLINLALLLPGLGVMVRRLHDTGRSGFWVFFLLVPIVGPIMLIVWFATNGTPAPNQYGPDPKAAAQPAAA
ncbi:DUF805 domain-containing protein [Promicromonospora iranensis]|nr:DUF805 domain-containing protein [Promicromonospora iranensis]